MGEGEEGEEEEKEEEEEEEEEEFSALPVMQLSLHSLGILPAGDNIKGNREESEMAYLKPIL